MRPLLVLIVAGAAAVAAASPPPEAPAGYARSADGAEWVFRPSAERDAAIEIRLQPAADAPDGGVAYVKAWMAAHPGGPAQEPTQPDPRVTAAIRQVRAGTRGLQQALIAIRVPNGQQQLLVVNLPLDRNDLVQGHLAAAGELGKVLLAGGPADAPEPAPTERAAAPPRDPRKVAGAIATVGFYTRTGFGVGGSLTFNPTPVVLFRSGDALKRIAALKEGDTVDAVKAAAPKDWTKWRRNGAVLELLSDKGWKKLDYQTTMDPLPRGFKLDGKYLRLSGMGNLAMGGTSGVTAWSELTFTPDGAFAFGGGASAEARSGDTRTFAAGESATRKGTYEIDGYVLTLRHAGGRVEYRLIVADPKDPGAVWIDGEGYTK